jgi:hypothetical protein
MVAVKWIRDYFVGKQIGMHGAGHGCRQPGGFGWLFKFPIGFVEQAGMGLSLSFVKTE